MKEKPKSDVKHLPLAQAKGQTSVLHEFQKHQSALRRFISRFVRRSQDIDDVAQEAFLRAYHAEKEQDIKQPKSFLFRIAHNVALTELTRKSSQIIDFIAEIDESDTVYLHDSAEDEVTAQQTIGVHCEAVTQLPPQCRRVYLMRKVHGLSHREIAERLGITVSTVEQHLAKGARDCSRYVQSRQEIVSFPVKEQTSGGRHNE